jgi:thioredoxin-like negative regulator of GroEL
MPTSKSKRHDRKKSHPPRLLIIGGVILLIAIILIFKQDRNSSAFPAASTGELPAAQLDRALAEHRPTLAFFHSTTCQQCIVMMGTVSQVYPEFSTSVVLVDVNVYDENNAALLQRVGLQYIPTLIFYDHTGKGQVFIGVLKADQLRQNLTALAGGE